MNHDKLAGTRTCDGGERVIPGEKADRKSRACHEVDRIWEHGAARRCHRGALCVESVAMREHDARADSGCGHPWPVRDDDARGFRTRRVRWPWSAEIEPFALHEVGIVDTGRV